MWNGLIWLKMRVAGSSEQVMESLLKKARNL
jgi:hypothetical protein